MIFDFFAYPPEPRWVGVPLIVVAKDEHLALRRVPDGRAQIVVQPDSLVEKMSTCLIARNVIDGQWPIANGSYLLPGRPAHAHEVYKKEANDAV